MKKRVVTLSLAALSLLGMVGCGNKSKVTVSKEVEAAVKDAMTLSRDDLMKKAVAELGDNQLKFLAVTSRGGKPAALNKFAELLNKAAGSEKYSGDKSAKNCPVKYDSTVDGQIYTTLTGEVDNKVSDGYSGAILQDGYQLQTKLIDPGYMVNYVPKEWNDATETDKTSNANPFTLQYNFKTWMVNNKNNDTVIDNVWDITDPKFKGKLFTMDPTNENVNMDWMIQLTDPKVAKELKAAYNEASNNSKVDLSAYKKYGEDLQYSYAFIANYIANAVFSSDDGEAVNSLAATPGSIGWIVYSKIQNVKETAKTTKKDIVISALGNENTDGATISASKISGFAGFMYKHYMSVMPNAKYPYATCAFLNVLSTTPEGYSAWAGDVGDYPSMPSINKDRTKGGNGSLATEVDKDGVFKFTQKADDPTIFPCLNDPSSNWWLNTGKAIVETPSFIGANYATVYQFIKVQLANK